MAFAPLGILAAHAPADTERLPRAWPVPSAIEQLQAQSSRTQTRISTRFLCAFLALLKTMGG
eukprot:3783322-Amphidinium_carterae.1